MEKARRESIQGFKLIQEDYCVTQMLSVPEKDSPLVVSSGHPNQNQLLFSQRRVSTRVPSTTAFPTRLHGLVLPSYGFSTEMAIISV